MIDAFWTKWRVRRLCKGDTALAGKWLDDYVGWLYGRLWVLSSHDATKASQAVTDAFSSAARHLDQWLLRPCSMSEWLGTWIDPKLFPPVAGSQQALNIQNQAQLLWTQSLSETASLTPELIDVSQQALSLMSRDDQEVMICRYLRLETPAELASHYDETVSDIQGLLYRARHSFRRSLESLTGVASSQPSKPILIDQNILEANLEKLFRSLGPKPIPAAESIESLRATILRILSEQNTEDSKSKYQQWAIIGGVLIVVVVIGVGFWLCRSIPEIEQQSEIGQVKKMTKEVVPEKGGQQKVDDKEQTRQALALVSQHDTEGILEILRNGPYSAQLIAAHYLTQFGDESAIDPLDKAAQKWYPDKPSEANPFVDAIVAIENRIRKENRQDELEKKKQEILKTALPLIKKRLGKTDPNAVGQAEPIEVQSEPNVLGTSHAVESVQIVPVEPNDSNISETIPIEIEPNKPNSSVDEPNAAEATAIPMESDANQIADTNSAI
jgi:DNA-directed RNA polymerase specialized sigma24 family protein